LLPIILCDIITILKPKFTIIYQRMNFVVKRKKKNTLSLTLVAFQPAGKKPVTNK